MTVVCSACGLVSDSAGRFCSGCGSAIPTAGGSPGRSRDQTLRTVSVVFADIEGSTAIISHRSSEVALRMLSTATDAMTGAIEDAGGTVLSRMGDGVMAAFGVPTAQPDHAYRACRAGLAIVAAVERAFTDSGESDNVRPQVRVGINTGEVALSAVANGGKSTYDVIGDQVNLAARLEATAEPDSVYVSQATWQRVARHAKGSYVGERDLKGFDAPVGLYRLEAIAQPPSSGEQDLPFVGRLPEVGKLLHAIGRLKCGHGAVCLVVGEPGVGKSRLLSQVAQHPTAKGVLWLRASSPPLSGQVAYWGIGEIVRDWLRDHDPSWPALLAATRQAAAPAFLDPDAEEAAAFLALMLGTVHLPESWSARVAQLSSDAIQHQVFGTLWRLFVALSRRDPVVLQFDDLQWIDAASLAVIRHLRPLTRQCAFMLVGSARSGTDPSAKAFAAEDLEVQPEIIQLHPLSSTETIALVEGALKTGGEAAAVYRLVVNQSDGNPFYVAEILRALKQMGAVTLSSDGSWELSGPIDQVRLPDSIQGLILARIDRLDERMREVLRIASVIGRQFLHRVLAAVTERAQDLDERMAQLKELELVDCRHRYPELEYMFKHAVVQETVYTSLFEERRRQIHRAVADSIESLFQTGLEPFYPVLAFHLFRAEEWKRAQSYLFLAADHAQRLAADDEALRHFERALALIGKSPYSRLSRQELATIERKLGDIQYRRGDIGAAQKHFRQALELSGLSDPRTRWGVRLALGWAFARHVGSRLVRGWRLPKPRRLSESEIELFALTEGMAWSHYHYDQERLLLGLFRALGIAEDSGNLEGIAKGSAALAYVLTSLGLFGLAQRYQRHAIACGEASGRPGCLALAENVIGLHYAHLGKLDLAIEHYEQSRLQARAAAEWITWGSATAQAGLMQFLRGDAERSLAYGEELVATGREIALRPCTFWGHLIVGRALCHLGRREEGMGMLHEAISQALLTPDFQCAAQAQGALALIQIEEGELSKARETIDEAIASIRRQGLIGHNTVEAHLADALLSVMEIDPQSGQRRSMLLRARSKCRALRRQARRFVPLYPAAMQATGLMEALAGRPDRAAAAFREATEAAQRLAVHWKLPALRHRRDNDGGEEPGTREGAPTG